MRTCPYCQRRLLSQASACCNWCGREIPDAGYQQQAEAKREAFFVEQALHDAVGLARMEAMDVNPLLTPQDPLTTLPLGLTHAPRVRPQAMPPVQAPPVAETPAAESGQDEDTTGGRFRHLEL